MKKYKIITTFLICLFLALNFASINSNSAYLEQFANIEFESEIESEAEKNNKSKLDYLVSVPPRPCFLRAAFFVNSV